MTTVIVVNSRFNPHYPVDIPKNTVNAEAVLIRLDSEWDNLTVRIHWLNVASNVEKKPLLELDQPNTIPWEVLTDLGELRMGLVGLDRETVIKPTIWLTYGYVVEGVDPDAGSDPQPPTPSWEQQMVEQAAAAANAAKEAKETADSLQRAAESGEFNGDPGPEGPPGKSPIIKDRKWWIWSVEDQAYKDTGILASGGGASSYNDLSDRPTIGGVLLEGKKTAQDLGLQPKGDYATTSSKLANPYSITFTGAVEATYDGSQAVTVPIPTIAGPAGTTPDIQIGTVDTLEPGSDATATITGTPESPRLNLRIPRGQNGKTPEKGIDYFTDEEIQSIASQAAALVPGENSEPAELLNVTVEDSSITFYKVDAIGYRTFAVLVVFKPDEDIPSVINGAIALNAPGSPWHTGYRVDPNIRNLPYSSSAVAKAVFYLFSVGAGYIIPIMAVSSGNTGASAYNLSGQVIPGFGIDKDTNSLEPFSEDVQSISVGSYTKYFGRGSKILVLGWE